MAQGGPGRLVQVSQVPFAQLPPQPGARLEQAVIDGRDRGVLDPGDFFGGVALEVMEDHDFALRERQLVDDQPQIHRLGPVRGGRRCSFLQLFQRSQGPLAAQRLQELAVRDAVQPHPQ
jgi:hypothetical protein